LDWCPTNLTLHPGRLVIVWVAGFTTKCMIGSRVGVAIDWARDDGWIILS